MLLGADDHGAWERANQKQTPMVRKKIKILSFHDPFFVLFGCKSDKKNL